MNSFAAIYGFISGRHVGKLKYLDCLTDPCKVGTGLEVRTMIQAAEVSVSRYT